MSFDYESPIKTVMGDMQMQYENEILKAVQNVDITVDKAELLKALKYDRAQYEKGYEDGKKGEWISVKDRLPEKEQNCIIWTGSACMSAFYLGNDEWFLDYYDRTQTVTSDWFTHWMEMPKPPKKG